MDLTRPDNRRSTPMYKACKNCHLEIVQWLITHGADTDVTRPSFQGKTPIDRACEKGHLNIVQYLIHHHRMSPDTLEQWHPRLSYSSKRQLHRAALQHLFDCQSFLTLATIVRYIKTEPYKVVVPSSSSIFVRLLLFQEAALSSSFWPRMMAVKKPFLSSSASTWRQCVAAPLPARVLQTESTSVQQQNATAFNQPSQRLERVKRGGETRHV